MSPTPTPGVPSCLVAIAVSELPTRALSANEAPHRNGVPKEAEALDGNAAAKTPTAVGVVAIKARNAPVEEAKVPTETHAEARKEML